MPLIVAAALLAAGLLEHDSFRPSDEAGVALH